LHTSYPPLSSQHASNTTTLVCRQKLKQKRLFETFAGCKEKVEENTMMVGSAAIFGTTTGSMMWR
jgi:hypothetical protein